jgi:hypothetical protein
MTRHAAAVPENAFPNSYRLARERFLAAASARGCGIDAEVHPMRGAEGETLAIDAACLPAQPGAPLLIVSSGCHGIEGPAGSAVQTAMLRDDALQAAIRAAGVEVLLLHALNPHGFSHTRRVTEDNVDLNRNFVDFSQPLPANPGYRALAPLLLPRRWPPSPWNRLRVLGFVARHGMRSAQAALSSGQYDDPHGLFFGGHGPTWSHRAVLSLLARHAAGRARVVWLDLHTGLGPRNAATRLLTRPADDATVRRARDWWGEVETADERRSASVPLRGEMMPAWAAGNPGVEFTGLVVEFGTETRLRVMDALRGDHWLHLHPEASAAVRARVERSMRAAFAPDDADWQRCALALGLDVIARAVAGLSRGARSAAAGANVPAPDRVPIASTDRA